MAAPSLTVPESTEDFIAQNIESGDYERPLLDLIARHVEPHHRVLEGGAGLGVVTRALTEIADFVVACEANSELSEAARENAPEAVIINRVLVGDAADETSTAHTGSAFGVGEESEAVPVSADALVELFALNALVLDVEGAEEEVLRNISLAPLELVIVELHPKRLEDRARMIVALLRLEEAGFTEAEWFREEDLVFAAYVRRD